VRVLIVGAGLGGLCLAHGLRRAGVEVEVFERRPSTAAVQRSYGIHLDANGLRALHACLPAENWAAFVAATDPAPDVIRFRDPALRTLAVLDREQSDADPVTRRRAVRRDALHRALLLGLDDVVHAGVELTGYADAAGAPVAARFTDGSSAHGDLLVGADGANSRVRAHRLPGLDRVDLGIVNIAGRLPLTAAAAATLPAGLVDGSVNNVVPAGRGWLFASTWTGDDDVTSLVWAWVGDRDSYPADVVERSGTELRDLVVARLSGWAPPLRVLIAATPPDTISPIVLRTMPTLPPWRPGRVTLIGDAAHAMTPMAGVGANTALRDADELCRALTDSGAATAPQSERVGRYEARMRDYANAALARSTRNARNAATGDRLSRLAFRTVLRVARAMPPVRRAVFGP